MNLILLPNQLFPLRILLKQVESLDHVYLIEEPRYFTDYKFHKLKLVYHRCSMKKYCDDLKKKNIKCTYYDFNEVNNKLYTSLNKKNTIFFNPIDHKLFDKFSRLLTKSTMINNLNYLLTPDEVSENKDKFFKNNKYYHNLFYIFQRKKLDILMNDDQPVGDRWSFDTENKSSLPKNIDVPEIPKLKKSEYFNEATKYVNENFPDNYGDTDQLLYPIDTKGAIKWLNDFVENRLSNFGKYQDAVDSDRPFLFHSVISPMMNIGILPDICVVLIVKSYYEKNKSEIPISSYEGFIRQVIGWRNYNYAIYLLEPDMYNVNKLEHYNKISDNYWTGNTNIKPLDTIIQNIVKYSYVHHIERLMFLGTWFIINFMDPKEVHRIFMEWTIDAYDWVMVPNVMGMSQYADGGKMMTRMYFCSSNYINKMSNFKKLKDDKWWEIWDAKYYSFINEHKDILKKNYATARQVAFWSKKSQSEKKRILKISEDFIA